MGAGEGTKKPCPLPWQTLFTLLPGLKPLKHTRNGYYREHRQDKTMWTTIYHDIMPRRERVIPKQEKDCRGRLGLGGLELDDVKALCFGSSASHGSVGSRSSLIPGSTAHKGSMSIAAWIRRSSAAMRFGC